MEFTEKHELMLQETHDEILKVSTVLLGANGDRGLVGKVNDNCDHVKVLEDKHNDLSRKFWVLIGILVGSGVLGTSAYELLKVIK